MPSAEYDLRYLRAGVEQLERYLLSKEIYWTPSVAAPSGEPPYPQLTLGWLLLSLQRLKATAQTPEEKEELQRLQADVEDRRTRWRVAWEKKARAELRGRLNLWRDFLEEYRKDPEANYDRYGYEVGRRVLVDLLSIEAGQVEKAENDMLGGLDNLLRALITPGEFVWEARLQKDFPQDRFWYLYGRLPRTFSGAVT